jgi:hypothetical protein
LSETILVSFPLMENSGEKVALPKVGHEQTDVPVRWVWLTAGGMVIGSILISLIVVLMFDVLARRHSAADQSATAQGVAPSISGSLRKFPEPRLQVAPEVDLAALRAREEAELNSYGWIDKQAGIVRIPIERAMELMAQRGLPVHGQPNAPKPTRTTLDLQQVRPLERETPPEMP